MILSSPQSGRERIAAMTAVALVHGLMLWLLVAGFGIRIAAPEADSLKLFDIHAPPPPPAPDQPQSLAAEMPDKAPAAPDLDAEPSPVVVPPPEVRLVRPSPVPAAPAAGSGSADRAGASPHAGPGTGAGGTGGGGSGAGPAVPARQIAGRIGDRDYPAGPRRARIEGRVLVRFAVNPDGRARGCLVLRSSGNPDLDTATCRLIERRFRFVPARDDAGRAIQDSKMWEQIWWLAGGRNGP